MISRKLKASPAGAVSDVVESTIRVRLNNNGVHGRFAGRKPSLSKEDIAPGLRFAQNHVDKPEVCWKKNPSLE